MITGDNRIAATAIAAEAGVDDFIAEAGLEDKLRYIRAEQVKGNKAGIIGKSIKDAPALALADVGIAMNNSSLPDDQAGNMIDLDNNPTKLIDVVEIGKQVLMTRKALTVIGIITCITNYFAAFPAVLAVSGLKTWTTVPLSSLNVLHLETPQSAIQSMVIWNALSILGMTWLTQRGIKFRSGQTSGIMNRQLFIYGLGCLFISLLGIKLIDSALVYLNLI
jgi:K+-transporting ATPase ATPase B chain